MRELADLKLSFWMMSFLRIKLVLGSRNKYIMTKLKRHEICVYVALILGKILRDIVGPDE